MPGVGKTALAVHAARMVAGQYPDGVFYLNLHTHDPASPSLDSAEALHRLLRMLERAGHPDTRDAIGERVALWRAQLSRRRAVVILDDAARHDQISPLLPAGRPVPDPDHQPAHGFPGWTAPARSPWTCSPLDDAVTLFTADRRAGPGPGRG